MPTITEIREQRKRAHDAAVTALASHNKESYERAMGDVDRLGNEIAKLEARGNNFAERSSENAEATAAFLGWMRRGQPNDAAEQRALATLAEKRDVAEGNVLAHIGSYSGLGFFVPTGFQDSIENAAKWFAPLLDDSTFYRWKTKTGNPIPWPTSNDTGNAAVLVSENSLVTTSSVVEPTAGQITFGAYKFSSGEVKASIELLQDSGIDLESWFAERFGERKGRAMENYLTNGTGVAQPTGLLTSIAASGASPVIAQGSAESTGGSQTGANSVGYTDLVDLEHSVDPAYRQRAKYMFHDTTLASIKKILDKYGRPIWAPGIAAGAPDTINGYKYVINQAMPQIGASNVSVAFGDFKKFVVRDVMQSTVIRLAERFADVGQVAFINFFRVDSKLLDAGTHPCNVLMNAS